VGGGKTETAKPVELQVIAENPEHQASESELWGIFAKENPGVTIRCESFEDTGYEAFAAKVNAGMHP
jgi:ABC-type glycerol-3-phosphate transport system substrate-binding protein